MASRRPAETATAAGGKGVRAQRRAAARADARAKPAPRGAEQAVLRLGRRWLVPGIVLAAIVAAAGIVISGLMAPPAPVANVVRPVEGSATAPVTVTEYSDYQCDYCGRWAREVEASFRSTFIATGHVRFEWHDDAWEGQESIDAANAARCAGDQGQFWAMHDLLYRSQGSTANTGAFTKDKLRSLGATLGLDTASFNACVDAGTYNRAVQADTASATAAGFSGTPAFSVNGQPYVGYQSLAQLTTAISAAASSSPSASAAP